MTLSIIIVNFRTPQLTLDCLHSIATDAWLTAPTTHGTPRGRVIVVDNDSRDDSVTLLAEAVGREGWLDWVQLIPSKENGGFAFGNNLAIRHIMASSAMPKYVLLLNPDTRILPGALQALVEFMDAHPRAGIAGSRLECADGVPQCSAFRFPTIWSEIDAGMSLGAVTALLKSHVVAPPVDSRMHKTDWVAGASMIVRREMLEKIGFLDDAFFMYFEEVDFCRRAAIAGWECWYVPESRVVHLVGKASGINSVDAQPNRRPAYWFESRRRYFQKHHGRLYAAAADAAWLALNLTWKVRRIVQRKPRSSPPHFWEDMLRHSSLFHGISRSESSA